MTKQELYDAYAGKFDAVTPVAEWKKIGGVILNRQRYDVIVYTEGQGFSTYVIYVEDDGGPGEKAVVGGNDPIAPEPPAQFDFYLETKATLDGLVTAGTILGYVLDTVGERVTEVAVYRDIAGVKTKLNYLVWADDQDVIQYEELGA